MDQDALEDISQEMLAYSFKKWGIMNALDRTEDDFLWPDPQENANDGPDDENDDNENDLLYIDGPSGQIGCLGIQSLWCLFWSENE